MEDIGKAGVEIWDTINRSAYAVLATLLGLFISAPQLGGCGCVELPAQLLAPRGMLTMLVV